MENFISCAMYNFFCNCFIDTFVKADPIFVELKSER